MGLLDALNTGARGLAVASAGINVTTQNVTGAGIEGYSRRSLRTSQLDPVNQRGLWIGQGATASSVARSADRLLGVRLVEATGAEGAATTLNDSLRVVESWFGTGATTGLAEALDGWFDALGQATADPSDTALRRSVVAAAEGLANVVSRIATGLDESVSTFEEQLGSGIDEVNSMLAEVASLNAAIGKSGATTGPGDLLDRRDQLLVELASRCGATAELRADGQAVVMVGGHAVVSGPEARALVAATDDEGRVAVHVTVDEGELDVTSVLGGQMGGLVSARELAEGWIDDLDDFAYNFATAVNTQHALGFDTSGNAGGDVFLAPTAIAGAAMGMAVDPGVADDADLLAFAGAATALAGDGDNLEAMLDLEDDTTGFGGRTARAVLSGLVADVGSAVAGAQAEAEAESARCADLETLRESISGVDTDEEATHLLEYQAAYRAAARVVSAADELLRQLLAIGG
ncbi:MAG: flagellar hook-associated protein FlgK [Deltaproteobacteria bacterium]|nr:flagellar hook-associated protein FlgK [Deltaproteobacteria bacterium]